MTKSDRLKILRMLSGYTQEELAKKINVPRTALSIWENPKKYGPSEESVPALAEALNVSPGYLTYGDTQFYSSVWIPRLPIKKHHQQLFLSELERLLPSFLRENKIQTYLTANLKEGSKLFMFSRKSTSDSVIFFDSLLLADDKIKNIIVSSITKSQIALLNTNNRCSDHLDTVDISNIDMTSVLIWFRISVSNHDIDFDFSSFNNIINKYKKRELDDDDTYINNYVAIEVFNHLIRLFINNINDTDLENISNFLSSKFYEFKNMSQHEVINRLKESFCSDSYDLKKIKLQQFTTSPVEVPQNIEYHTVNEWIKEELSDSKSLEKKTQFLEQLTCATNYGLWKEKFDQEVKCGKRWLP